MNSRIKNKRKLRKQARLEKKAIRIENRKKRRKMFLVILLLFTGLLIIYMHFIEPSFLLVHEYKVNISIDENYNGLKIVHFSDLHYGGATKEKELIKVINEINILKPDIVIFTGDLIEDDYKLTAEEKKLLIKELASIETKLGKYAVVGNHDYYRNEYKNIIDSSNFTLLINDYDLIYNNTNNPIAIYGLDNITYGKPNMEKGNDDAFLNSTYKILILHEPDYIDEIIEDYKFDIILAGHSHNQQINIPLIKGFWLPSYSKKYYKPYYKVNSTDIYISNGIGTSGMKLRFNSIPSINFFRFTK